MAKPNRNLKLCLLAAVVAVVAALACVRAARGSGADERAGVGARTAPPLPHDLFSPSNARTKDGKLIPSAEFFPAARCAKCHQDSHEQWAESLHRNAGREPFYKERRQARA